jgi:hypothetical protein
VPPAEAKPLTRPRDNKRIEENFIEEPQGDDGAILRLCHSCDNRIPTSNTTSPHFYKLLFFRRNLSVFRWSFTTSDRPFLCRNGLFCGRWKSIGFEIFVE